MTDIATLPVRWKKNATGETARDAAKAVQPKALPQRERVLNCIRDHGPMTPEQVSERTGIWYQSCRARCSDLRELGLVTDSGLRGASAGGVKAIAWRACTPAETAAFLAEKEGGR